MALSPEEYLLEYRVFLDASVAINDLRSLANSAASFDERIQAAAQHAELLGKKWGISGSAALKILQTMDAQTAKSVQAFEGSYNRMAGNSVVFGKYSQKAWSDVGTAVKNAEKGVNSFSHGIDLARVAIGTLVATLAFKAINTVLNFISNAFSTMAEKTKLFETSLYNLHNAERVLSESGIEVTFKDLEAVIDRVHAKFRGMFSLIDIQDAVADIAIATKDLGFSAKQIEMLSEAIGGVQLRHPELTFQEVEQHAITALLSGRTQSLQNMGIAANEATVKEKALEMGLIQTGQELTTQTKALAILQIMYDSTAKETEDLRERQNTLSGASQTLQSSWEDLMRVLGVGFAPVIISLLGQVNKSLQGLYAWTQKSNDSLKGLLLALMTVLNFMVMLPQYALKGLTPLKAFQDAYASAYQTLQSYTEFLTKSTDTATESIDKLGNSIEELQSKDLNSLISSVEGFADRMDKATDKFNTDVAQSQEDYYIKLRRSQEDYQIDVAKVEKDFRDKKQDADRKYRENESNAEAKFQQQLKELRDKYLFDLEDALRNRDARQVLRLMAQYKMDKEHLTERYALESQERKKNYQQELEDLKKQESDKLAEMAAAQALKEQRMKEDWMLENERRAEQYEREIQELKKSWEDRLREEATKLGQQYGLNESQVEQLYQLLSKYYGPSGYFDGLYDYSYKSLVARSQNLLAALNAMIAGFSSSMVNLSAMIPGVVNANAIYGGGFRAKGGIDIVNKPTRTSFGATYGEAGPEAHIFIPLSNPSSGIPSSIASSMGGEGSGKIGIELWLSPDLESRIVENSLNQAADVITRVRRSKG